MSNPEKQHLEDESAPSNEQPEAEKNVCIVEGLIATLHQVGSALDRLSAVNYAAENIHQAIQDATHESELSQDAFDRKHQEALDMKEKLQSTLSSIKEELLNLVQVDDKQQAQQKITRILAMIENSAGTIYKSKKIKDAAKDDASAELRNLTYYQMQESSSEVRLEELRFALGHWMEVVIIQLDQLFEHPVPNDASFAAGVSLEYHHANLKRAKAAMQKADEHMNSYLVEQMIAGMRGELSALEESCKKWLTDQSQKAVEKDVRSEKNVALPSPITPDEGEPLPFDAFSHWKQSSERDRQVIAVHIRWMIRRDMPEVLDIEGMSFEFPWSEEDFIRCVRQRNCIGMVSEHEEQVVGFMIYELHKTMLRILNIAVHQGARLKGVGTQMIGKLISKLSLERRRTLKLEVRETNVPAQIFFHRNDFRATHVLKDFYDDTTEDAYAMEYRYQGFEQEEEKKLMRIRRLGE